MDPAGPRGAVEAATGSASLQVVGARLAGAEKATPPNGGQITLQTGNGRTAVEPEACERTRDAGGRANDHPAAVAQLLDSGGNGPVP